MIEKKGHNIQQAVIDIVLRHHQRSLRSIPVVKQMGVKRQEFGGDVKEIIVGK